ncbi:hypothetical protein N3K66_007036 [Trichothecium roseum]|uniref:Uncharacterized protein n=1 Tax=Trichothecium roseum TaxID=47278 RepID=A0ACC0UX23_9HYPO|nr:hypothetical protein N3K66_007036 [Trichothecium roseum]
MIHKVAIVTLFAALANADLSSTAAAAPRGRGCLVSSNGGDGDGVTTTTTNHRNRQDNLPDSIDVAVNFHIASTVADENLITDAIVDAQWQVLRDSFSPHGINLTLNSTTRVVDDLAGQSFLVYEGPDLGWVSHDEEKAAYFKRTRRGGYDALNIHFFSKYSPGATGYCNWPTVITTGDEDDEVFGQDACQLSAMTMPGFTPEDGGFEEWNLGHLTVHEAGHWFGLNHTFAGGCGEPGDYVDDTPAQRTQVFGCPAEEDSCPDSPGLDPVHNFMGYTDDSCTNEFTPGQKDRMFDIFFGYRRKLTE